jgi:hypothetical protein
MIFVDKKKENGWIWSEEELKKYSTNFYAKETLPGKL